MDLLWSYPFNRMLIDVDPFWSTGFEGISPFGFPRSEFQQGLLQQPSALEAATRQDVVSDKDKFQVMLQLPQFKQDEIKVKVAGNHLVVEAEHEEKPEETGHHVYRRISRRFRLPHNSDLDKICSTLSEDGVLTVCAPKKPLESQNERTVEIKSVPAVQQRGQRSGQHEGQIQGAQKMEVEESGTAAGSTQIPVSHEPSKK